MDADISLVVVKFVHQEIRKIKFGDHYFVSSEGEVFSDCKGRLAKLKPILSGHGGYSKVRLYNDGKWKEFFVHRLVAIAFIENPENLPCVNHIDENPGNNAVENLEWCTIGYNNNYGTAPEKRRLSMKKRFEQNQEERERMRRQSKERVWKKESKEKISKSLSIPVLCILNGEIIAKYNSAKEAAVATGAKSSNISKVVKGIRKSAGGYQWKYAACGGEIAAEMEEKRNGD